MGLFYGDYLGLFFLGIGTYFIFFVFLFLNSFTSFYKRNGKLKRAKIKGFVEKTFTTTTNNVRNKRIHILPVIEYIYNGKPHLFMGSDQNSMKNYIGKEVKIYIGKLSRSKNKDHFVVQENNVTNLFRKVMVLFIFAPLTVIYFLKADFMAKMIIPPLGFIVFIPLYFEIKKRFKIYKREENDNRSFKEIFIEKAFLEDNSISIEEFEANEKYIKTNEKLNEKHKFANIIGFCMSVGFIALIYWVLKQMYLTKLGIKERMALKSIVSDFSNYEIFFEALKNNQNLMIFSGIFLFGVFILLFGISYNLKMLLR